MESIYGFLSEYKDLEDHIFTGYDVTIRIFKVSKGGQRRDKRGAVKYRNIPGFSVNTEIDVTLEELRRKEDSLQDFQKIVVKNIQEINQTTVKYLINQTDVIMKSLKEQTNNKTECNALTNVRRCYPGYDCYAQNYSGECKHKCSKEITRLPCKNEGRCYFDIIANQIACRCRNSIMTVYYGHWCEEKTGRVEFVVGLSVGTVAGLVAIFLLIVCCKRLPTDHRYLSKSHEVEADDFISNELNSDLDYNYFSQYNPCWYSDAAGFSNQIYERRHQAQILESRMYLPRRSASSLPKPKDKELSSFSIKRPKIFSDPVTDAFSPYNSSSDHRHSGITV